MSRIPRAPVFALREGTCTLSADLSHYLGRVLRLAPGARFVAFDPAARTEAEARIERHDEGGTVVSVGAIVASAIVAQHPRVLLQSLAKGDKLDTIVRDATELGATSIVLVEAERSVVRLEGKRRDDRRARLAKIAEEAARQSGRADPPTIEGPSPLAEAAARAPGRRFALAPRATLPLGPALLASVDGPLAFAVGPEGGFAEAEIDALVAAGFEAVTLGSFVLRTETVAAAVLGAVRVLEPR